MNTCRQGRWPRDGQRDGKLKTWLTKLENQIKETNKLTNSMQSSAWEQHDSQKNNIKILTGHQKLKEEFCTRVNKKVGISPISKRHPGNTYDTIKH
jgi:hypothetical protein